MRKIFFFLNNKKIISKLQELDFIDSIEIKKKFTLTK